MWSRLYCCIWSIKDYDNMWDTNVDAWHRRVEAQSSEEIFIASEIYHTPYNTLYLSEDTDIKGIAEISSAHLCTSCYYDGKKSCYI